MASYKKFQIEVGSCPKCGRIINSLSSYQHNTSPDKLGETGIGIVACGGCLSLLCWGDNVPLRLVTEEEIKEIKKGLGGEEGFKKLMDTAEDRAAFNKGFV